MNRWLDYKGGNRLRPAQSKEGSDCPEKVWKKNVRGAGVFDLICSCTMRAHRAQEHCSGLFSVSEIQRAQRSSEIEAKYHRVLRT
jgi:hypothetical protein